MKNSIDLNSGEFTVTSSSIRGNYKSNNTENISDLNNDKSQDVQENKILHSIRIT